MPGDTLLCHRGEILAGIDPAWAPFVDGISLDAALAAIPVADVTPPPPLILEALRYGGPADVTVVILGQDPYDSADTATGLCFSTRPGRKVPESLNRIFGC